MKDFCGVFLVALLAIQLVKQMSYIDVITTTENTDFLEIHVRTHWWVADKLIWPKNTLSFMGENIILRYLIIYNALMPSKINNKKTTKTMRKVNTMYMLVLLLLISWYIELNPGPRNYKYPCGLCKAALRSNQQGIFCYGWEIWLQAKYINMTETEYYYHAKDCDSDWYCASCTIPAFRD